MSLDYIFDKSIPVSIALGVIQAVLKGHLVLFLPNYVKGGGGGEGLIAPPPLFPMALFSKIARCEALLASTKGASRAKKASFHASAMYGMVYSLLKFQDF